MFYDIFSSLCIIHKTTPAAVAKELEITNAAVSKWRQGAIPRDFTIRKIADYFDVTVDYLLEEEREKTFWENYSKLCSERGESPNSIAAQLGYSSGSVTAWKQGRVPKYQTLEVIAKHFGVSVEYLLKEPTNMFWRTFLDLCVAVDKSPTAVGNELGFSRATVSNWRYGGLPRDFALVKISDYFGVTVDYLLGNEQEEKSSGDFAFKDSFIGRIEELLKSRKIQKSKMLGDLNLSVNSFTNWKNRGTIPSGDTLRRIADYFGVTVDYLLGKEKTQQTDLIAIQQAYSRAPEEIKIAVRKLLDI